MLKAYINFASSFSVWALVLVSGLCVVLGDYFGKLWSVNLSKINLFLSILFYFLSTVIFLPALLREGLTVTSIVWSLISILGFLIIGLVIFRESLTTIQIIAAILGVASLILFSFPNKL